MDDVIGNTYIKQRYSMLIQSHFAKFHQKLQQSCTNNVQLAQVSNVLFTTFYTYISINFMHKSAINYKVINNLFIAKSAKLYK